MKKILGKVTPTAAAVAVSAVLAGGGGAFAASQITSAQIKDHTITQSDMTKRVVQIIQHQDLRAQQKSTAGQVKDLQGAFKGLHTLDGAVYRVENYQNGGGGDATVACADTDAESQKYTAIAGGVQAGHVGTNDFAVAASFPGRMDWNTNQPKAGRLDGWIVLGNGVHTDNLKIWALCVPNTDIEVQQVDLNN